MNFLIFGKFEIRRKGWLAKHNTEPFSLPLVTLYFQHGLLCLACHFYGMRKVGCIATGGKSPSCLQETKDLILMSHGLTEGKLYMKGASRSSSSALGAASSPRPPETFPPV